MDTKNTDSAFPYISFNELGQTCEVETGLSKREYLFAHAPEKVPDWFNHASSILELTEAERIIWNKFEGFPETIHNSREKDIFYSVEKKRREWDRQFNNSIK